jgi:hypothetical protein
MVICVALGVNLVVDAFGGALVRPDDAELGRDGAGWGQGSSYLLC